MRDIIIGILLLFDTLSIITFWDFFLQIGKKGRIERGIMETRWFYDKF